MDREQFLKQVRGNIPKSLYQELEYCMGAYAKGKMTREAYVAVLQDVRYELELRKTLPSITTRRTRAGKAYRVNPSPGFNLLSEPTEGGFVESYHELAIKQEEFRAETPLEQKGRLVAPIYLDRYPDLLIDNGRKTMGIDVAREGDDKTVFTVLYGGHVIDICSFWHSDIAETTGRGIALIEEHRPDEVIIDVTGGYGAGVADNLKSLGITKVTIVTEIQFHGKPRDEKYGLVDARTEMHWNLSRKLREGKVTLPYHVPLIEELGWITIRYRLDGKLTLMSKEEMKKKHGRSPDHADSLALAGYPAGSLTLYV